MAAFKLFRPWDDSWRQMVVLNTNKRTQCCNESKNLSPLRNSSNTKLKRHTCCHCGRTFYNKSQLKGHLRIHTGERPFRCDRLECGKTFTRREELIRHERTHTGLRPYPCSVCNKRFGRKDHLKKHTRIHVKARINATAFLPIPKTKQFQI